ncbi:MAG: glycosyltransferase family 39 protein, partial [Candidatus Omnitrophica bacterium]|nr:glycosyltransferase family 39 protein [Candidatus Omnitrophota bacterium]
MNPKLSSAPNSSNSGSRAWSFSNGVKNNWFCFFIFAAIVFIIFGNALFNSFVYDDHYLIKDNKYIQNFSYLGKVLSSDVTVASPIEKTSGYYRPFAMLFLMLMYKIWGLNTFGLHLTTVLNHLANTFFLFLLIKKISNNTALGLMAGVIFAVHPIHVEAVTPIFNFMGILATLFSLASFLAFVKSQQEGRRCFFVSSIFLFFCALFSKEEAITLPAAFILYDFCFLSDFNLKIFSKRARRYTWFLIPVGLYILARLIVIQKPAALGFWGLNLNFNVAPVNFLLAQVLSTLKIFFDYLVILIFPFKLSAYYLLGDPLRLTGLQIFSSIFVVLGLIMCAFYFANKDKMVSFFIFFFFISSFMVSNIIPIGGLFAERFMYLPSVSFCFLLAYVFLRLFQRFQNGNNAQARFALIMVFIFMIGLYAQAAVARNYVWRNDII